MLSPPPLTRPSPQVICWDSVAEDAAARSFALGFYDAVGAFFEAGEDVQVGCCAGRMWQVGGAGSPARPQVKCHVKSEWGQGAPEGVRGTCQCETSESWLQGVNSSV